MSTSRKKHAGAVAIARAASDNIAWAQSVTAFLTAASAVMFMARAMI